jgi:hypothetical protein
MVEAAAVGTLLLVVVFVPSRVTNFVTTIRQELVE